MKTIKGLLQSFVTMLVSTSVVLSSLAPTVASAQSFNDIIGRGGTHQETRSRRMNAAQMQDARAAKALFESVQGARTAIAALPPSTSTEAYDPRNSKRAAALKAELQKAMTAYEPYRAAGTTPPTPILIRMRDAVTPFVRFLDMMRQASGQAPPLMVAPGAVRSFDITAYCMDHNLPSPKQGETFRIVPIDDLLPPQLLPLVKAMMAQPGRSSSENQSMIWAFRNAYRYGQPVDLDANRVAALQRIYPQAAEAIDAYNRKASRTKSARGLIDSLLPGMRQNVSSIMDTAESMSPQRVAQDVRTRLASLESMPVQGDINPQAAYTTLTPGVAAYATSPSGGAHNAVISIANTTDQPYRFDQTRYAAQSERQVQHLALQLPTGFGSGDGIGGFSFAQLASFGLDISTVGNIKALLQAVLGFDLITGEPVNRWMQVLFALPILGQEMRLAAGAERLALRTAEREAAAGIRNAHSLPPAKPTGLANAAAALPSPWTLNPFKRGQEIEQRLGHNLQQNYPVIDKFNWTTGEATSIKSLDLNAKSYQTSAQLERAIDKYAKDVGTFVPSGKQWGVTPPISPNMVNSRTLEFVIPHGGTAAQQAAIQAAVRRASAMSPPVKVNVVVMP